MVATGQQLVEASGTASGAAMFDEQLDALLVRQLQRAAAAAATKDAANGAPQAICLLLHKREVWQLSAIFSYACRTESPATWPQLHKREAQAVSPDLAL